MSINVVEAFQFPFQDKDWITKLAITFILLFIPILGWFAIGGYAVRLIRNVLTGVDELPDYDDMVGDFSRGLAAFLGGLIYNIPSILLSCCSGTMGDNAAGTMMSCFVGSIQFVYGLAIGPFVMAAVARYALNEDFGAFLDFGGRFDDVTSHVNDAVVLWISLFVLHVAMAIIVPVGIVLCCIPGLFAIAAGILMDAHLTAQWGRILGVGGPKAKIVTGTYEG